MLTTSLRLYSTSAWVALRAFSLTWSRLRVISAWVGLSTATSAQAGKVPNSITQ